MTDGPTEVDKKGVVLKLQPLSDIDINIWSNKVRYYYQFKVDLTTPNTENNATPAGPTLGETNQQPLSLRGHKEVDYTSVLTSDLNSEPETVQKKPKTYRPSGNRPSALRQ